MTYLNGNEGEREEVVVVVAVGRRAAAGGGSKLFCSVADRRFARMTFLEKAGYQFTKKTWNLFFPMLRGDISSGNGVWKAVGLCSSHCVC
jgi:hypothetical protein